MSRYSLYIWNGRRRIKYPKDFDLPDLETAQGVALRVAQVFVEVVPYWNDLSVDQRKRFMVEIVEQGGSTVIAVPFTGTEEAKS